MRPTIAALLSLVVAACSKDTVPESEAVQKIQDWASRRCVVIPIGAYRTPPLSLLDDQQREHIRSIVAFKEAGVVTYRSQGSLIENVITVALDPSFDNEQLSKTAKLPCLRETTGLNVTAIHKIDPTEGGTSIKWKASLVYILYDYPPQPALQTYRDHLKRENKGFGKRKGVFLFKKEPINSQWVLKAFDSADQSTVDFPLKSVAAALRQD